MTTSTIATNTTNIKVLVAGRHTAFLDGVASLLKATEGIEVARDMEDVAFLLGGSAGTIPDVVVTPVGCGSGCQLDSMRRVRRRFSTIRFVAISPPERDAIVIGAFRAGASACLTTNCTSNELILAVKGVYSGQVYLDPGVASTVIRRATRSAPDIPGLLTYRELAVLALLAEGGTNKQIALELELSVNTIKTRLARIYEKLDVSTRSQAVARGLNKRFIDLDQLS